MTKLRSVIRHEYTTIVKQPSFWIMMTAIPVLIATVITLSILGNKASEDHIKELTKELTNVAIVDESGLLNKHVVESAKLTVSPASELDTLREATRTGKQQALIVYPAV
jgi:ABC-type Na+ efflux pump permease subunit